MLATILCSVSGIPGGIFSPSLAVGAGFGANVAALLPHAPLGAVVLLGMAGYFAGVVQAPITAATPPSLRPCSWVAVSAIRHGPFRWMRWVRSRRQI